MVSKLEPKARHQTPIRAEEYFSPARPDRILRQPINQRPLDRFDLILWSYYTARSRICKRIRARKIILLTFIITEVQTGNPVGPPPVIVKDGDPRDEATIAHDGWVRRSKVNIRGQRVPRQVG